MLGDRPLESAVFGILLLSFRGGTADRELQYSMVFTVSNDHHIFLDQIGLITILDSPGLSWEAFWLVWTALGYPFLKCCFFTLLRGTE